MIPSVYIALGYGLDVQGFDSREMQRIFLYSTALILPSPLRLLSDEYLRRFLRAKLAWE
jgi:hypothetical protein